MALPHLVNSIKLLLPYPGALELICWPIVSGANPYSFSRYLTKLAGSLAILPTHRAILRHVCRLLEGIGDFHEGLVVLEKAWEIHDAGLPCEIHWQDIMHGFGWTLLLS